jgi:RHS repeat-associated protein
LAFKYDGLGRRVQKVFTQNSTSTTTNYLYDGNNAAADLDQSGNVLARYAAMLNIDEPLAELRSSVTSYYSQDGIGSVTSLTTSAGGLGNTYRYDTFGNLTASSGSVANRFQYAGRELDSESGVYFYRARYYDSSVGRFLSADPVGYVGGDNFYSYVENDPADFADPMGLCPSPPTNPCGATLPPDARRRTMVNTLMGEMSGENMVGQNQYGDDESGPLGTIGAPGGAQITDATLDLEASLMAGTILNRGHIGNVRIYKGLPEGRAKTGRALKSPAGSPLCVMLLRAINAVNSPSTVPTTGWRAVVQGTGSNKYARALGSGIRVAGTDFLY